MLARVTALVGAWFVLAGQTALAQQPYRAPQTNPYSRPALSPYLNLLRGGNPAINYYGLVRPQQEFNSDIQQLQQAVANPLMQQPNDTGTTARDTGHEVRFLSYTGYFLTVGRPGSGGGAGTGVPGPTGTNTTFGAIGVAPNRPR